MTDMTLKQWLEALNCTDVQNVRVTINGQSWEGCRYKQHLQYSQGMDCVSRGEKKAGEYYIREKIYLIGKKPEFFKKACFPFGEFEWYCAAYITEIKEPFKHAHPFGVNFLLSPWDLACSKVDDGEPKSYTRYPMTVEEI